MERTRGRCTNPSRAAATACSALALWLAAPAQAQENPAGRAGPGEIERPIRAHDSVFLEELTWLEVRDALRAGRTTAIVTTGGIEKGGPYLALGRQNVIARALAEAIARRLGDALVAPVVGFAPHGREKAGSERPFRLLAVTEETFRALLLDLAESLRAQGFETVVLIGNTAEEQPALAAVAVELQRRWKESGARAFHIPEHHDPEAMRAWLVERGLDPQHCQELAATAVMMTVDPDSVRMRERIAAGQFRIDDVSLAPAYNTIALGREIVARQALITSEAIRRATER